MLKPNTTLKLKHHTLHIYFDSVSLFKAALAIIAVTAFAEAFGAMAAIGCFALILFFTVESLVDIDQAEWHGDNMEEVDPNDFEGMHHDLERKRVLGEVVDTESDDEVLPGEDKKICNTCGQPVHGKGHYQ